MPYTTPTPSTVSAGDTFPASAYNIISADLQDHESRIKTGVESYTTTQKNALAGVATGTMVYDSTLSQLQVYQGAAIGWGTIAPAGMIAPYINSTTAPAGWLICNGQQVSQATYAALYAAVGPNRFGTDTGGNFFLPDLQGRVPVGVGSHTDVSAVGSSDGSALASRRPKHLHTASSSASVSETSTGGQTYASIVNNTNFAAGSGIGQRAIVNSSQAGGLSGYEGLSSFGTSPNHTHSVGVSVSTTVGPQTNSPSDGPAYLALGFIIKT